MEQDKIVNFNKKADYNKAEQTMLKYCEENIALLEIIKKGDYQVVTKTIRTTGVADGGDAEDSYFAIFNDLSQELIPASERSNYREGDLVHFFVPNDESENACGKVYEFIRQDEHSFLAGYTFKRPDMSFIEKQKDDDVYVPLNEEEILVNYAEKVKQQKSEYRKKFQVWVIVIIISLILSSFIPEALLVIPVAIVRIIYHAVRFHSFRSTIRPYQRKKILSREYGSCTGFPQTNIEKKYYAVNIKFTQGKQTAVLLDGDSYKQLEIGDKVLAIGYFERKRNYVLLYKLDELGNVKALNTVWL